MMEDPTKKKNDQAAVLSRKAVELFFGEGVDKKVAAVIATRLAAGCCRAAQMSAHTSTDMFLTFYKDADAHWTRKFND